MTLRVRTLSPTGDFVIGEGLNEYLRDSPEAVAQIIGTRLRLWSGEWFLNLEEGTPYRTKILGEGTLGLYDQAIRERILATPGVIGFDNYASALANRALRVVAKVDTQFGDVTVSENF